MQNKRVKLTKNIQFRVPEYIHATDFRNNPQWKDIFSKQFKLQYLTKNPIYHEKFEEAKDRLVITSAHKRKYQFY